ncbi:MAG: biopolymer transporter ExbD [Verrucomicrobiota bacterium]|nr:biopolymer transporter ExbD [Verrucomicrobiota bacterium]
MAKRLRDEQSGEPPMSSMIDVVFLLLIYFIVTFKDVIPEAHMAVNLPSPSAAQTTEEEPPDLLDIEVHPNQYILKGTPQSLESIKKTLQYLGELDPDMTVMVKTNVAAYNKELIALLDLCKGSGLTKLNVVTLK